MTADDMELLDLLQAAERFMVAAVKKVNGRAAAHIKEHPDFDDVRFMLVREVVTDTELSAFNETIGAACNLNMACTGHYLGII